VQLFWPCRSSRFTKRKKNETLDDRQRALESLARTITTSAEQISIAAGGLHEIAELAQKKSPARGETPPPVAGQDCGIPGAAGQRQRAEKEELEKEVAALRTTESERLDSISDKIFKASTEWAKLEITAQKRLTAAADTLAKTQAEAVALDAKLAATLAALESKLVALEAAAKNISARP